MCKRDVRIWSKKEEERKHKGMMEAKNRLLLRSDKLGKDVPNSLKANKKKSTYRILYRTRGFQTIGSMPVIYLMTKIFSKFGVNMVGFLERLNSKP